MTKQEIFYNRMVANYCEGKNEYTLNTKTFIGEGNEIRTVYWVEFRAYGDTKKLEIGKEEYECLLESMKEWEK